MECARPGAIERAAAALSAFLAGLLGLAGLACADEPSKVADVVFLDGAVYTVDAARSWATAVAVRGHDIVFVGDDPGARGYVGPATRVVDLHGRMLLPGFQDSHLHPTQAPNPETQLSVAGLHSGPAVLARIGEYAKAHPKLPWIVGKGLEPGAFEPNGLPTREQLDQAVADKPAFIFETSLHMAAANSKALDRSGMTAATKDPLNGRIGRDAAGHLTGALYEESAMKLVSAHVPAPAQEQRIADLSWALRTMTEVGITAAEDALVRPEVGQTYKILDDRNELHQRVNLCLYFDPTLDDEQQIKGFLQQRRELSGRRLTASCIKFLLDGGYGSHGLFLLEPYSDDPARYGRSRLTMAQDRLNRMVTRLDAAGFQIHMHANGDGAVRAGMDALTAARGANGVHDNRPTLAHLALVSPQDLNRFRRLGIVANMTPVWSRGDVWETEVAPRIFGPARAARNYPTRSLLDSGAVLVWGTDWPVTTLNPLEGIETAVTHRFPGGVDPSGKIDSVWNPSERVSLEQAITAYTAAGAYLLHEEGRRGSITAGRAADLIVLDENLFELPPSKIHTARVDLTMADGRIVFERSGLTGTP
jgi:hypothetical protein